MSELEDLSREQFARRLANLVRIGTVEHADYAAARARVRIGTLVTDWLPWMVERAGPDRDWAAPEVGEQVVVLSPSGDSALGVIAGRIYRDAHPANGDRETLRRVTFADGTVCEYDRAAHRLHVNVPQGGAQVRVDSGSRVDVQAASEVTLTAGAKITLAAPLIALNGDVTQDAASGPANSVHLRASHVTIEGPVTQTGGDMTSDGVSAQHHTHGGVEPGGGNTGEPN